MKNKIFIGLFLIIILLANVSFAYTTSVTMSVVEEPVCTINFEENSKFEKKLIAKDLINKEVTLQLQVTNEEKAEKPTGEIMLVLDNSNSMNNVASNGKTRKELIFESAKTLVTNLLKDNADLKIGIISFSTNTDVSKEGTTEDANIVSALSNDASNLNNAISNIEANGPRTNLESGLLLASTQFTKTNNNKYMIILTDGVPNVAIDYDKTYYSDDVINKTKQQLQALNTQGIKVITMLSGIEDVNYVPAGVTKSFGDIITEIFGTQENPTVDNFYNITDSEIEKTITEDIYSGLIPTQKTLKNITVIDYFPDKIVKNFEFAYVSNANIGNISTKIDTTNNSIVWTIPELSIGETAVVQYKLKLKENFDSSIIDKILNTNEKVDISYDDFEDELQTKTSDISPKIKLIAEILPTELPKAGTTSLLILTIFAISLTTFSIVKLIKVKNKMK